MIRNIHYISDLHLERNVFKLIPPAGAVNTTLFLAGDIGNPWSPSYRDLLLSASDSWKSVYLVAGNHEYWNRDYECVDDRIREVAAARTNLHFLDCSGRIQDGKHIVGGTFWSWYSRPASARKKKINAEHLWQRQRIEWLIRSTDLPTIVMTHHLPSFKLIQPQFAKYNAEGWASHSDYMMRYPVEAWVCGHSHIRFDKAINGVRVLMAARGSQVGEAEL